MLNESDDLDIFVMTFYSKMILEKRLRPIVDAASQKLGILRKSWLVFYDSLLIDRVFGDFIVLVLEYCPAVWCSYADTHFNLLDRVVIAVRFLLGVCLSVTLHIVDMWQYYACCIRLGLTRCPSLWCLCHCGLRAVLCLHIGIVMLLLAEEPSITAGLLFTCQYLCGTILVTEYSIVWN